MIVPKDHRDFGERIRIDPVYFIYNVLGVTYLTTEQIKIIESVWYKRYTEIPSAHGVGKTFIAAVILLAYLIPFPDTIILSTAPTGRQVKDLLWAEVGNLYSNAKIPLGGKLTSMRLDYGEKWFATGIATDIGHEEKSAVKFQGYHASRLLAIVDEACGVHPAIWGALDGIASGKTARILAIGNPAMINVPFHKHTKDPKWNIITISALTHPNVIEDREVIKGAVSRTWVEEKIKDWCVEVKEHDPSQDTFDWQGKIYSPNNLFRWKVLGRFPKDNEEGLFDSGTIRTARYNELKDQPAIVHMAIDVARFGEDSTVFTFNRENEFTQRTYQGLSTMQIVSKAVDYIKLEKPSKVGIDADGVGSGVYDRLKEMRQNEEIFIKDAEGNKEIIDFQLISIQSGTKPVEFIGSKKVTARFLNLRCQMYWQLRLDLTKIKIPLDEKLEEELISVDYETPRGIITIMSKDDIKVMLGRSPDRLDSLVYCNWLKYIREKRLRAMNRI